MCDKLRTFRLCERLQTNSRPKRTFWRLKASRLNSDISYNRKLTRTCVCCTKYPWASTLSFVSHVCTNNADGPTRFKCTLITSASWKFGQYPKQSNNFCAPATSSSSVENVL